MKLKVIASVLFVFVAFSSILFAGQFRCGFLKQKVETTLSIPRPPDILVSAQNIRVEIVASRRMLNEADKNRIRNVVEQNLTPDFIIDNRNPEAIFKITVVDYDRPIINTYTQHERRRVVVDKECKTDKNGKEKCSDKYDYRNVPVRYWEATAHTSWSVEVVDSYGTPIDNAFTPAYSYKSKQETSVNGVSKLGSQALPAEHEINRQMIDETAAQFVRRYRKTYDYVAVDLACGEELDAGNKRVRNEYNNAGKVRDWEGALNLWKSARMKKKENEADRLYNMAVAYEALALQAFDESGVPEDADPQFNQALRLYQQAMLLDPGEKYIQRSAQRVEISKANLKNAKDQMYIIREQFGQTEDDALQEEDLLDAMKRPSSQDADEEKEFRSYARASFENSTVVNKEDQEEMVSEGRKMFNLDELQARRVVGQEAAHKGNVVKYKERFENFARDGVITKSDRDGLKALAKALSLTANDIKLVESQYTFKETN